MTHDEIVALCQQHTLYPWRQTEHADAESAVSADGVYVIDGHGRRLLDFSSQLVCVNVGHRHPHVRAMLHRTIDDMTYFNPRLATELRARAGVALARVFPPGLGTFLFTLSGADANEHALKIARQVTGRRKILSRERSYHGATLGALFASGDSRRAMFEPGPPGYVRVPAVTATDATEPALATVAAAIEREGGDQIAAMIIETVPGSNGVLVPPPGYLEGLHALLQRHGILLVCDEVMTGFGRTGKMFAFEHFGVVPDIVTCAKGLTSAYAPMGCVAVSNAIAEFFRRTALATGLTYSAHPLGLAAAIAVLEVMEREDLVARAATTGVAMRASMEQLRAYPAVRDVRSFGLLGAIEIAVDNQPGGSSRPLARLVAELWNDGLATYAGGPNLMVAPPLCITGDELANGFSILARNLARFGGAA